MSSFKDHFFSSFLVWVCCLTDDRSIVRTVYVSIGLCSRLLKRELFFQVLFYFYQFLLMGAVPFRKDVPRLKQLGVGGVITLNEPFETLVPSSLYNVGKKLPQTLCFETCFCVLVECLMVADFCYRLMKWTI